MTDIIKQFFDETLYIETYPDVVAVGINPWEHFRRYGIGERRQFSRLAPPGDVEKRLGAYTTETIARYLADFLNSEDEEAESKLNHAIRYGSGHSDCRVCEEIKKRASLAKLDSAVREHKPLDLIAFLCEKTNEIGIDLDDHLSVIDYMRMYPDVAEANVNAYFHYYVAGRAEGRRNRLSVPAGTAKEFHRLISNGFSQELKSHAGGTEELVKKILEANVEDFYLFLSHDNPLQNLGGIQQVVASEFDRILERDGSYLHIFPEHNKASFDDGGDTDLSVGTVVDGTFCGYLRVSSLINVLRAQVPVIQELRIHHLFGQNRNTLDLISNLTIRNKSYIIHDHSFLCDGYHLLRNNLTYCNAPPLDSPDCTFCVHGESRRARTHLLSRLNSEGFTLSAPSSQIINICKKKEESVPVLHFPHWTFTDQKPNSTVKTSRVNVAYCGFDVFHKGYDIFLKIVRENSAKQIIFHYFGAQRPADLPENVSYLKVQSPHLSAYAFKVELTRRDIHIVVMPSRCPESFGFIAHEAKAAGCTVIVSDYPHQPVSETLLGGNIRTTSLENFSASLSIECDRILRDGFTRKTLSIQLQTTLRLNND